MLKLSFQNLWRRKSRTVLSLIGIIIGVASIIALVSLVDGLTENIVGTVSKIQGIIVLESGSSTPFFSVLDEDYKKKLEAINGVKSVSAIVMEPAESIDGKDLGYGESGLMGASLVRLLGSDFSGDPNRVAGIGGEITKGRNLKRGEKGKVVIGTEIEDKYNKFLGNSIKINGKKFQIVGVFDTGSVSFNSTILMSLDDFREITGFPKNKVMFFSVQIFNPEESKKIAKMIEFKYPNKLKAISASQFGEALASILGTARLLVLAVAAISALVAGIGIINTMLMSVMERFKEIGTLKATGWTDANIMRMILYESLFLGIVGGLIGLGIGWISAMALSKIVGFPVYVSLYLLGEAFAFAVIIGIIAGFYPAWRAGKVDPIEVLRAE